MLIRDEWPSILLLSLQCLLPTSNGVLETFLVGTVRAVFPSLT